MGQHSHIIVNLVYLEDVQVTSGEIEYYKHASPGLPQWLSIQKFLEISVESRISQNVDKTNTAGGLPLYRAAAGSICGLQTTRSFTADNLRKKNVQQPIASLEHEYS